MAENIFRLTWPVSDESRLEGAWVWYPEAPTDLTTPRPAEFIDPTPLEEKLHTQHSFEKCAACDGRGFLRKGSIPDTQFLRCKTCEGCGQRYLDPKKEKKLSW